MQEAALLCGAPWIGLLGASLLGCGGPRSSGSPDGSLENSGFGFTLEGAGGTYSDGSGLLGSAALVTLRDASGAAPTDAWSLSLFEGSDQISSTEPFGGGPNAYGVYWWPAVAAPPVASLDELEAQGGPQEVLGVPLLVDGSAYLEPAVPALSTDGTQLQWPAVSGAASYECRVTLKGATQLDDLETGTSCKLGSLPAGAYAASVLAYSADVTALGQDSSPLPGLPTTFDVSEGRLALALGGSALSLRVAGGTLDFGTSDPGIALWVELLQPDGGASPDPWTLSVLGPGIPAADPITFDYPAANGRATFWEYDVPATAGSYSLTATDADGGTALSTSFSIGPPAPLPVPAGVSVQTDPNGGVTVQWSPVAGAASYDVTAWTTVAGSSTFYAGQWVDAPPASFPKNTFVSGTAYDVYVAATNVDMLDGGVPARLSVSENSYQPASFTAP